MNGEKRETAEEIIRRVLDVRNPFSTVPWDFDSQFDDVRELERECFVEFVVGELRGGYYERTRPSLLVEKEPISSTIEED